MRCCRFPKAQAGCHDRKEKGRQMSEGIQMYRFDEAVLRVREDDVRGRGLDGKDGGNVQAYMYPFDPGIEGLNLRFSFDRVLDGFYSPRHRHNFDQFRYVLSGTINIGKGLVLAQGECGYFPEGTYYGAQDQKGDGEALVMQFPGPQAAHFITQPEYREGVARLKATGAVFENGVCRRTDGQGREYNQDGFEAVWESFTGEAVTYAPPRYGEPVIIKPEGFRWLLDLVRRGLEVRPLGTFNEYRTSLSQWRLSPGAVIPSGTLAAPEFRFVLKGEVTFGGKRLPVRGAAYIPDGIETGILESRDGAEILVISVPMYAASLWRQIHETRASFATAS
jgi:hypothetical protein